jgi:hypothetical protein
MSIPDETAEVVRHDGDVATVLLGGRTQRLPVVGFPKGWRLRAGDRVTATSELPGLSLAVVPLVKPIQGRFVGLATNSVVTVDSTTVRLLPATQRLSAHRRPAGAYRGQVQAYCVENVKDDTLTCLALREIP